MRAIEADAGEMGRNTKGLCLRVIKKEMTQPSVSSQALHENLEESLCMCPKEFNSGAKQRDQPPGLHLRGPLDIMARALSSGKAHWRDFWGFHSVFFFHTSL